MSECGVVYNADQNGSYLYPLHFEGWKSGNFWAIFRRLRHFQVYNFGIPQHILQIWNNSLKVHYGIFVQHKVHLEMWANAQRDGRPAENRWRPLFNAAKFGWRPMPCSNAAKTRKQLKFTGVPQTGQPISAANRPKLTILSGTCGWHIAA